MVFPGGAEDHRQLRSAGLIGYVLHLSDWIGQPRVVVVGCGRMGTVRADACRLLGARVVALHDVDRDAA